MTTDGLSQDIFGFLLWIFIRIFIVIYLLWAFITDNYWISLNITYYPNRIWCLIIPTYLCLTFWCIIIGYIGYCYKNVIPWTSINSFKDDFSQNLIDAQKADNKQMNETIKLHNKYPKLNDIPIVSCVPNAADIDIREVNKILFDHLQLT
mmetsp:Transcript_61713/g.75671  ORF Transcript_61713/g.75671 Transcript_61713/m.75671 type:complete len:150 (+) Transcript_61713:22-471(+)